MFSHEWIEKFDASRGIPRKANEQYLPAYQAFWAWAGDVGQAVFFIFLGLTGASLSLFAGHLLEISGLMWLVFWSLAVLAVAAGFLDAYLALLVIQTLFDEHLARIGALGKSERFNCKKTGQ